MLKLYICEDDPKIVAYLKDTIEKTVLMRGYDMHIDYAGGSPELLLECIESNEEQNVYFLDVDLNHPVYNGFELAQAIRRVDSRGFIIFVTTHGELVFETFKHRVEALDYITKDDPELMGKRIGHCLDSIQLRISHHDNRSPQYFSVKVFDEHINIDLDTIMFFETSTKKHRIIVNATDDVLEFFGSLNELEETLPETFMRVHRSFLVNTNNIKRIKSGEVEFKDGSTCLVSRTMRKTLLDHYE